MNVYARKYSHPRRVTPRSSVTKRYAYRDGKLTEIPLTADALVQRKEQKKR